MDKVEHAQRELQRVEEEMRTTNEKVRELMEHFKHLSERREQLKEFLRLADKLFGEAQPTVVRPVLRRRLTSSGGLSDVIPLRMSTSKRVADTAALILSVSGTQTTRELVRLLEEQGVEVPTENPNNYVAVVLSRDERFESDRAAGWSLKSPKADDGLE